LVFKSPEQNKDTLFNQTGGFSQIASDHKQPSLTDDTTFILPYKIRKLQTAKKNVSRILPIEVKQSKEDLYEKALTAQIKVNDLTEDNRRLQTRL
jgi:hypothetical protein